MINYSGQFAVTMIHDGLMRDIMKAKPRQEMAFSRRIGSVVKALLKAHIPAKNKRVVVFSDEENSPTGSSNEDLTPAKKKRVIDISDENSPSEEDTPIFEVGSDTCALCEGLAKVFIHPFFYCC
jgi:hypothetical protein